MSSDCIAIDARYVRERPSGIGAMVSAIVRRVPALMPDVGFLLIRHPHAKGPLSAEPNVREVVVRAEANGPGTLWWLSRLVDLREIALFHAPFNILPARLPAPAVVTIHDVMWLTDPALCGARGIFGLVQTGFYRDGIRRALRAAHHIIAVSHATHHAIARLDEAAASRTRVIYHGVDPAFSPARSAAERREADDARTKLLPGAREHVLVVGQSAPYKNQRRAVEAFLLAFRDRPHVHLALVQRLGDDTRSFVDLARHAGAAHRVHVLPAVGPHRLVQLYRGAICLCQPSLCEGWGMPVTEAQGAGCAVVASRAEALVEVAAGAALHVDATSVESIAEGLGRVAHEPELRERLVRDGLDRVRRLSWDEHAKQTAELYRRALGGAAQGSGRRRGA